MSTAVVDMADLLTRVADIRRIFDWCDKLPHGMTVELNHTENNLSSVNGAFFRLVRQNPDGSWERLQSVSLTDPLLLSLAADLQAAHEAHIELLRRIERGGLQRSGGRRRLSSVRAINDGTQAVCKLGDFLLSVRRSVQTAGEAVSSGWGAPVSPADGFKSPAGPAWGGDRWGAPIGGSPDSGWGSPLGDSSGLDTMDLPRDDEIEAGTTPEPVVGVGGWGQAVGQSGIADWAAEVACAELANWSAEPAEIAPKQVADSWGAQMQLMVANEVAKYTKDAADKQAASDARWEEEIKGLRGQVHAQQQEVLKLKAETSVPLGAGATKRESEVQALRQELKVEQEGRKRLEKEMRSLKEEVSALRETPIPAGPDLTTKAGLDSLTRLILSSVPFAETISRLLSVTVGHTLSLSVGCFAIIDPERVLQVANACGSQHSLAALGVLHDLPAWAGERDRLFKGLVGEALTADLAIGAGTDSRALDEEMLARLKAGELGDIAAGEAKAEDLSVAFAEEREVIKSAWVDLVQAIKAQCQTALSEITQHRLAAAELVSAAVTEAVRAISEQSELELLGLEGKADKLDRAMLDFQRLYPVPDPAPPPIRGTATSPTTVPHPDSVKILALLEQLVAAQPAARSPSTMDSLPMSLLPANSSLIPTEDFSSSPSRDETTAPPDPPFNSMGASRLDGAAGPW